MRRRIYAALAATVALPMLAGTATAQQDRGYGYGPADDPAYHWSEGQNAIQRDRDAGAYAGEGGAPQPPRTPGRYVTDWGQAGQGRDRPEPPYTPDRYITDWNDYGRGGPTPPYTPDRYVTDWDRGEGRGGYGSRPYADDRWSERNPPMRDFDRPSPPPGYYDSEGYHGYAGDRRESYERGYAGDPYAHARERHHREMMARHREMMQGHYRGGYEDRDFRRDFSQDGRRGYYQDPAYEGMPQGRQRMGGGHGRMGDVDMRQMRQAMRMIDRFDVDGDGRVTQREVDQYRSDRLRQFDSDQDEQLTLEEYAALWADAMRERMVRRFQRHDRDGDARISVEEFSAATGDLVRMRDRNRDEAVSEDDFMRPEVAAPLGGSPNEPAESRVPSDDDVADYDTRPEVEAPMEGTPNEPAGTGAAENGDPGEDEGTPDETSN